MKNTLIFPILLFALLFSSACKSDSKPALKPAQTVAPTTTKEASKRNKYPAINQDPNGRTKSVMLNQSTLSKAKMEAHQKRKQADSLHVQNN